MAEGWARHLFGSEIDACSAGTAPQELNTRAVEVMSEAGVDISGHASKMIDACDPPSLDLVVTVCGHAREQCPVFQGDARVIHRGFDDPPALAADAETNEDALAIFRRVRDEIRDAMAEIVSHVGVTGSAERGS